MLTREGTDGVHPPPTHTHTHDRGPEHPSVSSRGRTLLYGIYADVRNSDDVRNAEGIVPSVG